MPDKPKAAEMRPGDIFISHNTQHGTIPLPMRTVPTWVLTLCTCGYILLLGPTQQREVSCDRPPQ